MKTRRAMLPCITMSGAEHIGVIGGGVFGCASAARLAGAGYRVSLFERHSGLLLGATRNCHNRLHIGCHYPRSPDTARQCIDGLDSFRALAPVCVCADFSSLYLVASAGSLTTSDQYARFCASLGIQHSILLPQDLAIDVLGCDIGIQCNEPVFEVDALRHALQTRLVSLQVALHCGSEVAKISRGSDGFFLHTTDAVHDVNAVVDCSYADLNRLRCQLGHAPVEYAFEYAVVPVLELDLPRQAVTVMDGPFCSLLPQGSSSRFLLYDVRCSRVESHQGTQMDPRWRRRGTSPFSRMRHDTFLSSIVRSAARFIPAVESARLVEFLEGPRILLPGRADDARPSFMTRVEAGFFSVFSGKVSHASTVADSVLQGVREHFGRGCRPSHPGRSASPTRRECTS